MGLCEPNGSFNPGYLIDAFCSCMNNSTCMYCIMIAITTMMVDLVQLFQSTIAPFLSTLIYTESMFGIFNTHNIS